MHNKLRNDFMASRKKRNDLRITEIMQQKDMTLADLAKRIQEISEDHRLLTSATLSARINGNPSLSNLYELSNALGVKITELFPVEEQAKQSYSQNEIKMQAFCPHCGAKVRVGVVLMAE